MLDRKYFVKIYDYFYSKFANMINYNPDDKAKSYAVEKILDDLSWNDAQAIQLYVRFYYSIVKGSSSAPETIFRVASKMSDIPEKKLRKMFDVANRHMYAPSYIELAVPGFYNCEDVVSEVKELTKEDFDGKKYIVTALNRQGILYNYQLKRHLHKWYYLWTIPGIGDAARQQILMTINDLEKKNIW